MFGIVNKFIDAIESVTRIKEYREKEEEENRKSAEYLKLHHLTKKLRPKKPKASSWVRISQQVNLS